MRFYFDTVFSASIISFEDIVLASLFHDLFYILDGGFKDHLFALQIGNQNIFKIKKKEKRRKQKKRYLLQFRLIITSRGLRPFIKS